MILDVEKDIPTSVDQGSYNPIPIRTYGRAHLVGEIVFYGSLSTEKMKHYFNTSFEVFDFSDKALERQYFSLINGFCKKTSLFYMLEIIYYMTDKE